MNDKSGLDLQGLINIVHNFQHDASKSVEKEKLLKYLITSFDRYVSSMRKINGQDYEKFNEDELDEVSNRFNKRNRDNIDLENQLKQEIIDLNPDFDNDGAYDGSKSKFKKGFRCFRNWFRVFCITKGKRYGNFLLVLFIFVKILYVTNSILQLFMLNQFLGNDFLILGIEVITKVWNGDDWSQINRFPRVTLCDFRIREVGIVHRYTVQCVLSINMFNEKIFIFLWYWLCFLSIFNIFDLIGWSYSLIINSHERYIYVKRRLLFLTKPSSLHATSNQNAPMMNYKNKKMFRKFVNNYLKEDGVLALRLLSCNAQDLIVSEVISKLYDLYVHRQPREAMSDDDDGVRNARPHASLIKNRSENFQTISENLEKTKLQSAT